MNFLKKEWFKIGILIIGTAFIAVLYLNLHKDSSLSTSDLNLKCQDIYAKYHKIVEEKRYGVEPNNVIWSTKTKSCLADYYLRPPEHNSAEHYSFEVWDYSNSEVVLGYYSEPSKECSQDMINSWEIVTYKQNSSLEGAGCHDDLLQKHIDLLTNFHNALRELGFKL
jgi:hypothetical protein